jgi:hypothetical protein
MPITTRATSILNSALGFDVRDAAGAEHPVLRTALALSGAR